MEKYGVEVEPENKLTKTARRGECPKCGSLIDRDSNPAKCPKCGTEPFEKKPEEQS